MTDVIAELLSQLDLHPVLVDIGASGEPPEIWQPISQQAIFVGFDPDLREIREIRNGNFYRATIINKAVTVGADADQVRFFLTRSPYCSSTLRPELEELSAYLFSDLFVIDSEEFVPGTTLEASIRDLGLNRIHWMKTDSQGTDLRLFTTLPDDLRAGVLALDTEPGLIHAYQGEDLFIDAHRHLLEDGFWLSDLEVHGTVRVRRQTLERFMGYREADYFSFSRALKKSPGWCAARYLRSFQFLTALEAPPNTYVLLWIFAMVDNQPAYALDVAVEYERRFGSESLVEQLRIEAIAAIQRGLMASSDASGKLARIASRVPQMFGRLLRQR